MFICDNNRNCRQIYHFSTLCIYINRINLFYLDFIFFF